MKIFTVFLMFTLSLCSSPVKTSPADALFLAFDKGDELTIYNLFNDVSESVMRGFIYNSSRFDIGTVNAIHVSYQKKSVYDRQLAFLNEIDRQFLSLYRKNRSTYPKELSLYFEPYPEEKLKQFPPTNLSILLRIEKALRLLYPSRQITSIHGDGNKRDKIDVQRGISDRLKLIEKASQKVSDLSSKDKLYYQLLSTLPIATTVSFESTQRNPKYTVLLKLPSIYRLEMLNSDDPKSWYLKKGIPRTKISSRVQVDMAKLTYLSYLYYKDPQIPHMIESVIHKDPKTPQMIKTQTRFGRYVDGKVLTDNIDDSLVISFVLDFPLKEKDNLISKRWRSGVNKSLEKFNFEAFLHEVHVDLYNEKKTIRSKFDFGSSKISFRAALNSPNSGEKTFLGKLGFTCNNNLCFRDYTTYTELASTLLVSYLLKDIFSISEYTPKIIVNSIKSAFGFFVQASVNRSIRNIEKGIDHEFNVLTETVLNEMDVSREKIVDRLHKAMDGKN